MIDVNVLRLADTLLFKEPSLLQSRFERKALKDMFEKVAPLTDAHLRYTKLSTRLIELEQRVDRSRKGMSRSRPSE